MKLIRETIIEGQRYAVVAPTTTNEFFCRNCSFTDLRRESLGKGMGCPYYVANRNDDQEGCSNDNRRNKNNDVYFLKYETFLLKQLKGE